MKTFFVIWADKYGKEFVDKVDASSNLEAAFEIGKRHYGEDRFISVHEVA